MHAQKKKEKKKIDREALTGFGSVSKLTIS